MNDLFRIVDDFNTMLNAVARPSFDFPKYNVSKDKDGNAVVELALAGFDKSELNVTLAHGFIEISGSPSNEKLRKNDNLLLKGIAMKPFKVRMATPFGANVGGVKFENGILSFSIGEHKDDVKKLTIE